MKTITRQYRYSDVITPKSVYKPILTVLSAFSNHDIDKENKPNIWHTFGQRNPKMNDLYELIDEKDNE